MARAVCPRCSKDAEILQTIPNPSGFQYVCQACDARFSKGAAEAYSRTLRRIADQWSSILSGGIEDADQDTDLSAPIGQAPSIPSPTPKRSRKEVHQV